MRGLGDAAVLLSLADTTEETRLKRQVAQATKMQAVGQLAGGVAHDFNNVLTAIIGYCDLMLLRHLPGDSDYDDIQQIKANSNRAASLTRHLLAFSRQQTLQPEVIQLPDVISEVSQLLKRLLGARITLKTHHDRELGPVRADPRQLEQVIVNLAVNARDAIQAHGGEQATGTLTFSTRRVTARDVSRKGSEIIPSGDYTVLVAEDTGGGIPPANLAKIFEPFFTTKEQGKGTGLGLSTVYGIVKQSGGFIFVDNVVSPETRKIKGARFTIYLPVHEATEEELRQAEIEEEASEWSGGGRILLVEDEDMVRAVAERALTRQGYTVVTAGRRRRGRRGGARQPRLRPRGQRRGHAEHGRPGDGARDPPAGAEACRCCSCRATPRSSCAARSTSRACTSSPSRSAFSRSQPRSGRCCRRRGGRVSGPAKQGRTGLRKISTRSKEIRRRPVSGQAQDDPARERGEFRDRRARSAVAGRPRRARLAARSARVNVGYTVS